MTSPCASAAATGPMGFGDGAFDSAEGAIAYVLVWTGQFTRR